MHYTDKLKILRQEKQMTQAQVAEYLNTDRANYNDYERGKHAIPFDRLCDLADLYGVSLDWIAGRTTKREINY